jgi:hypothetical protein
MNTLTWANRKDQRDDDQLVGGNPKQLAILTMS